MLCNVRQPTIAIWRLNPLEFLRRAQMSRRENARIEFSRFNPTLGFTEASANLIGVTHVDLGNRTSGHAHQYVKCRLGLRHI
jgi:hypothetical protein